MGDIPKLPFERILKKAGAKRVAQDALEEFSILMEERMLSLAAEALALAKHAGRKTITDEDVRVARRKIQSS
ncbi:MAG: NFYB/HAP3 family transcription factor subunit [Candidatus Aenigmarchaeota archaeon]|nr:NFYB/HAP3 family transcription factor subunit [Candidatus Aenigmarchaeota archaeon]